jgi:endonuclease/exonuclease/phosphatase family metal-dependent hydrolase
MQDKAWAYLRNQLKPDIALLQEVNQPELCDGEQILFRKVHQNWGTAVYTRNILLKEFSIESRYPGRTAAAQVKLREDQKTIVISIHAPIIEGRVFPYLEEIFQEIEEAVIGKTFIIGGDLNTARLAEKVWPGHGHGPFFKKLAQNMFFDCHQKFHTSEEQTYFRPNSRHPFQDDHLFVSHNLADYVKSCHTSNNETTRNISDHVPLVAEIEI